MKGAVIISPSRLTKSVVALIAKGLLAFVFGPIPKIVMFASANAPPSAFISKKLTPKKIPK